MGIQNNKIWAIKRRRDGTEVKVYPHRFPNRKFKLQPSSGEDSNLYANALEVETLDEVIAKLRTGEWTIRMSGIDGKSPSRYSLATVTIVD